MPQMLPGAELRRDLSSLLVALALVLLWDASGLDLPAVRIFGSAAGFVWRDHWLTHGLLHEGARVLGNLVLLALVVNVWRPLPFARRLSRRERLAWLATLLLCVATIPLLKAGSLTSCPWSLEEFGGSAHHVSHWLWGVRDGGGGGCFPSGHASTAFCLLSGWFALRRDHARAARIWLCASIAAGLLLGLAQTMRGAHYPSHTLWTAWICLALCTACHHAARRVPQPMLATP
jgi:membrane-associated PAP2 superfamily phosphatase